MRCQPVLCSLFVAVLVLFWLGMPRGEFAEDESFLLVVLDLCLTTLLICAFSVSANAVDYALLDLD